MNESNDQAVAETAATDLAKLEAVCNYKMDRVYQTKIYAAYRSDVAHGYLPEGHYAEGEKEFLQTRTRIIGNIKGRIASDLITLSEHLDSEVRRLAHELRERLYRSANLKPNEDEFARASAAGRTVGCLPNDLDHLASEHLDGEVRRLAFELAECLPPCVDWIVQDDDYES